MLGGRFRIGTSIANPKEVRNRETFGHWELDTVVFPEAKARVVQRPFQRGKRVFTQLSRYQTEQPNPCFQLSGNFVSYFQDRLLKPSLQTGERSLPVISWQKSRGLTFTLQMSIPLVKERGIDICKWLTQRIFSKEDGFSDNQ